MRKRASTVARTLIAIGALTHSLAASAFKIDTHLWVAQQVFNDVADDGQITVKLNGSSITIPVPYEVSSAIRSNRNAFLMGNMGPDVLPDVVVGQMLVHPGHPKGWKTNDWLTHILNRSMGSPVGTAMAYGYLCHASADVFSHTYVNQYSGDIFVLADETLVEQRHVALETYIGKHSPPYRNGAGADLGPPYGLVVPTDDVATFVRDNLIYDPQASAEYAKSPFTKHLPAYRSYRNAILDAANDDVWRRIDAIIVQAVADYWGYDISTKQAGKVVDYLNNKVLPAIHNRENLDQQAIDDLNGFANKIDAQYVADLNSLVRQLNSLKDTINQKLAEKARFEAKVCHTVTRQVCRTLPWPANRICNDVNDTVCELPADAAQSIARIDGELDKVRAQQLATANQLHDKAVAIKDSTLAMAQSLVDLVQVVSSNTSPFKSVLDNWVKDLDVAMAEYVKAASKSMINTMDPVAKNLPHGTMTPMWDWFDCYHLTLMGVPAAVGTGQCGFRGQLDKTLNALNDVANIVGDSTSLGTYVNPSVGLPTPAQVRDAVTALQERAKKALVDAAIKEVTDLLPVEVRDMISVLGEDITDDRLQYYYTKPETVVPPKKLLMIRDIAARIKAEMHVKPAGTVEAGTFDPEQYAVVYNSVLLAKLALLDNAGLTQLAMEAGVPVDRSGAPLFNGVDNVIAHSVASIDGNHQWLNVAPPYPSAVAGSHRPAKLELGYPSLAGYSTAAGLRLWVQEARTPLFRGLFIGPLTPGIESAEEFGFPAVLPGDYPYRPSRACAFPNSAYSNSCADIKVVPIEKVLPAILSILLDD